MLCVSFLVYFITIMSILQHLYIADWLQPCLSGSKVVAGIFYGLEWQGANLCAQKNPKEESVTDRSKRCQNAKSFETKARNHTSRVSIG